jgi:UDP-N-acetyl-D-glucosamine dehydrogenase
VITDHDAFDYGMISANARYILDTRNRMRGPHVERL